MADLFIPQTSTPIAGPGGQITPQWQRFLADLATAAGSTLDAESIRLISLALGSPDGTPENIPEANIIGIAPVRVYGTAGTGYRISLADLSLDDLSDVDGAGSAVAGEALVFDGTNFVPGAVSGGFVPTLIASGATFTVPADTQALFAYTIDAEGLLVVDGMLIEVS